MKTVYTFSLAAMIAIALACGYGSKNYSNPWTAGTVPAISQLNPSNATAGDAAFSLSVNGKNFAAKATVNWNGVAQSTTYVAGNQLVVSIAPGMIVNPATVQITVTNPPATGNGPYSMGSKLAETSQAVNFTIN